MNEAMNHDQTQTCPQCDNHCPADDLKCGKGRKYFGLTDEGHDHEHCHGHDHHGHHREGLAGLLHQCGRFVCHSGLEDAQLFQALTEEEKASLQTLLEKLAADWQARGGEFGHGGHHGGGEHCGHKHHGQ